jgi:hypothetical protein
MPAEFIPDDFGRRKKFVCPKCKRFVISPKTEKNLSDLSEEQKNAFSIKSSRCPSDHVLFISTDAADGIKSRCIPESDLKK